MRRVVKYLIQKSAKHHEIRQYDDSVQAMKKLRLSQIVEEKNNRLS